MNVTCVQRDDESWPRWRIDAMTDDEATVIITLLAAYCARDFTAKVAVLMTAAQTVPQERMKQLSYEIVNTMGAARAAAVGYNSQSGEKER